MSNDSIININELSSAEGSKAIGCKKLCIICCSGSPIGIALDSGNAMKILGNDSLDTINHGHPISQITSGIVKSKKWLIPILNGNTSSNIAVLSSEFVKINWEKIQLNFKPKIVDKIAQTFKIPTLPHVKLEANNHRIIQSSPNFDFGQPHIKLNNLVKSGFRETVLEINALDTSVSLVKEKGHGTDLTQITSLVPMSWLKDFKDINVAIETIGSRDFLLKKSARTLKADTAYVLTYRSSTNGKIIAVNKQPSEKIQTVIDNNSLHFTYLGLDHTQESLAQNIKLTQFQAGNFIAESIEQAISKERTTSRLFPMKNRTQFFAASGDPRVIDLIQKVPVSFPVTIKNASRKGFFRRAAQGSWGRNQHERDHFLEHDLHLRKQFNTACDKMLTLLRSDEPQIVLVKDKNQDVVCVVTGNHEVAHTMKTLEL